MEFIPVQHQQPIVGVGAVLGEWIQMQFPYQFALTQYTLIARISQPSRMPRVFYIVGSNDGSTWNQVDYRSYTNNSVGLASLSNNINNAMRYNSYRIVVNALYNNVDATVIDPVEWNMLGTCSTILTITDASLVNDNAWHHAATTFTSGSIMRLYLDGILKGSVSLSGITLNQTTSPIQIGADNSANFFIGSIANVRVWNRVQSDADISQNEFSVLRNTDLTFDGLHGSYPLNDESSNLLNIAPRIGGYGGSGAVVVSVPTVSIFKKINYGLSFHASTGAVQCTTLSGDFVLSTGTIDCWIKTASRSNTNLRLEAAPLEHIIFHNHGSKCCG